MNVLFSVKNKWERHSCLIKKIYQAALKAAHCKSLGLQLLTRISLEGMSALVSAQSTFHEQGASLKSLDKHPNV